MKNNFTEKPAYANSKIQNLHMKTKAMNIISFYGIVERWVLKVEKIGMLCKATRKRVRKEKKISFHAIVILTYSYNHVCHLPKL